MTKEEILDEQIEAMEKLLKLKSAVIEEQDNKIQRLEQELSREKSTHWAPAWSPQPMYPGAGWTGTGGGLLGGSTIGLSNCPSGGFHEYPLTWSNPNALPPCTKCGYQQQAFGTTLGTIGGLTTNTTIATSGYSAPADGNVHTLARK